MPFYKFLLRFVQVAVVLIVLPRVASFIALLGGQEGFDIHDVIRWSFAAALGLGVMATSYFSEHQDPPEYEEEAPNPREKKRREREEVYFKAMNNVARFAGFATLVFAVLDGTFNLADALYGARQSGILDPVKQGWVLAVFFGFVTIVFGVSPTVLSIVLGRVISAVDRVPKGFEKTPEAARIDLLYTVLSTLGIKLYSHGQSANLLRSEDIRPIEQLPTRASGERLANTERTPNAVRLANERSGQPQSARSGVRQPANGEQRTNQRERVFTFLDTFGDSRSIRDIRDAMEEPRPSVSTIADALNEWRQMKTPSDGNN